jgi:hypothetical protein
VLRAARAEEDWALPADGMHPEIDHFYVLLTHDLEI